MLITIIVGVWLIFPLKEVAPPTSILSESDHHSESAPVRAPGSLIPQFRPMSDDKKVFIQQIESTQKCYESNDCDFPNSDPRAYELAVGKRLAELLKNFRETFKNDPSARTELETIGREYMGSYDGFVQEEALKILALFPPSRSNMESIVDGLNNTPDPLIVEQAMNEMKRYLGSQDEALVLDFLTKLLSNGAQFSSEKASELILPFINEKSFPLFQKTLADMPQDSIAAKNLKAAIDEYLRLRSGS